VHHRWARAEHTEQNGQERNPEGGPASVHAANVEGGATPRYPCVAQDSLSDSGIVHPGKWPRPAMLAPVTIAKDEMPVWEYA